MQKKGRTFVALVLTCCLALGVSMAQAETLSGTAQGFGGEVKVTVTMEDGVITDCVIEGDQETAGIGSQAIEQMPEKIVAANGVDVDGVAGATITSEAVLTALSNALNGEAASQEGFTPGTYTVETYGLNAPMTVVVTVDESSITNIEVPVQGETIGLGDEAIAILIPEILETQSTNVDAVTAATYTSNVLLRAVNEALTMAGGNASMLANNGLEEDAAAPEDTQTQLVVIGGGAAGMTTALACRGTGRGRYPAGKNGPARRHQRDGRRRHARRAPASCSWPRKIPTRRMSSLSISRGWVLAWRRRSARLRRSAKTMPIPWLTNPAR